MPDIAKCLGTDCPLRHECYRYTAPSNTARQAWIMGTPCDPATGTCAYLMPINEETVVTPPDAALPQE